MTCEFADIIDVSFLIIINHIDWVPTRCRLGANLVLSWGLLSAIMSTILSIIYYLILPIIFMAHQIGVWNTAFTRLFDCTTKYDHASFLQNKFRSLFN